MKGLKFSVAVNEFSLAAICITLLATTIGYELTHRTYPPVPPVPIPVAEACSSKAPEITIEQTFYIPVTVPPPVVITPETTVTPQDENEVDPVFQHRTPIITDALRTPMSEMKGN